MEHQASLFKDDILKGISLSIKNLQHQQTEAKASNPDVTHCIAKYNPHFRNLLNFLDLSFSFGLKDQRKGYWPFVKKIAHSSVIGIIEQHKKGTSEIKKGYIWLFLIFIEDSIDSYIKLMTSEMKMLKMFYKNFALLRDTERREIFVNLLAGIETLTFMLNLDDPYMDYGHDPVLRQEKIIIRVHPSPKSRPTQFPTFETSNQPDVTLSNDQPQNSRYPDLLSSELHVGEGESEEDFVHHVSRRTKKHKKRTLSGGDFNHSIELEEDNFIPEMLGSPEYKICLPNETGELLKTSDPMLKDFSEADGHYNDLLTNYANDDDPEDEGHKQEHGAIYFDTEDGPIEKEFETSLEDVETTLKGLTVPENEGYRITYVSDDDAIEEKYEIFRSDSFDRFCRGGSPDNTSIADEQGILAEADTSQSPTAVTPQITEESLRYGHSPATSSLSRSSIDKLNNARLDTRSGILLPGLPRRPDYHEASSLAPQIRLDQNTKVLLSLDVFRVSTEQFVLMHKVNVGHLAGLDCSFYLLISNVTIYLLKKYDNVQSGYICMKSLYIDNINKVQIGLNFQDIFFLHDKGCYHISTSNEIVTRSIVATIKALIKSSQGVADNTEQPMADNTNEDLDSIIQDWLICHDGAEDPVIAHFSLLQYAVLSSPTRKRKVMKVGNLHFRQSLLGIMARWEEGFFVLQGHTFNQYSAKKNEIKYSYDLSSKCGGCVRSATDGKFFTFKINGADGTTPILELGVENENEANDWLMTICQVVGDAKNDKGRHSNMTSLISCGLVMAENKLFLFNQDPKSGRLLLEDTCSVLDITQVCVDNENRTYCTVFIQNHLNETENSEKTVWLFAFASEFELGKFEKNLFICWQSLYQVPLQFVLLSDESMKTNITSILNQHKQHGNIGKELLLELINS